MLFFYQSAEVVSLITLLNGTHKAMIDSYLSKKPIFAQFMNDVINEYGYENGFLSLYSCTSKGKITCLFAILLNNLMIYSDRDSIPTKEILDYLNEHNIPFSIVKGEENLVKSFEEYMEFITKYGTHMCILEKKDYIAVSYADIIIEQAMDKDVDDIIAFFNQISEFRRFMNEETVRLFINYGHTYMAIDKGKIVALVICNSTSSKMAAISSIATLPEARNKGYATKLLSYICNSLLKISQSCSVCYDKSAASTIYTAVGFKEVGRQAIYIK